MLRAWVFAILVAFGATLIATPAHAHRRRSSRSSSLSFGFGFSYSRQRQSFSRPGYRRDFDRPLPRRYVDPGPPLAYYGREYDPYDYVPQPRYDFNRYDDLYWPNLNFGYQQNFGGYSLCPCCGIPIVPFY